MTLFVNKKFLLSLFFAYLVSHDFFSSCFKHDHFVVRNRNFCPSFSFFFLKKDLVSIDVIKKIGGLFAFVLTIFSLLFLFNPLISLFLALIPLILLLIYTKFSQFKRKQQFLTIELHFVRSLGLQISSGVSVVDAIEKECEKGDKDFAQIINDFVTFRQHSSAEESSLELKQLTNLLLNLIDSPLNATEKIKAYEEKLQIEHDFRRRSGQALLGVRIQAMVIDANLYRWLCLHF